MQQYDSEHEEGLNAHDLVHQYEAMLKEGALGFLESASFMSLIDHYEDNNQYGKALQVIRYALKQHPFMATFHVRKAQILLEDERIEEAQEAIQVAKSYQPNDFELLLTEAEIYQEKKAYNKALDVLHYATLIADEESKEEAYMLESSIYETMGDYDKALDILALVLKKSPQNEIAYSRVWMYIELSENFDKAIKIHQEIIDIEPYSYWAWYNLGYAYARKGDHKAAVEAFDYAIVVNERFEFAYRDCIDSLIQLEEFDEAMRYLDDYAKLFELDAEMHCRVGECWEGLENFLEAVKSYQKAIKVDHLNGKVFLCLALCYAKQEEWQTALRYARRAHHNAPENEDHALAIAIIAHELGNVEEAHTNFRKAIDLAPANAKVWLHYIEFLMDEGLYSLALEILDEAEEEVMNTWLIQCGRAAVLIESGQRQEGILRLHEVLDIDVKAAPWILKLSPDLEDDLEVMQIISDYIAE